MGEIKSAFEKAMEKVEKLEKASPEELRRMEYVPKGKVLAATYLKQEGYNLEGELTKYEDSLRRYLIEGVEETFLRNITLPQDNHTRQTSERAMEGILILKGRGLKSIFEKMEHLFNYYEQARQQAYEQLRNNFEMQVQQARAALEQTSSASASARSPRSAAERSSPARTGLKARAFRERSRWSGCGSDSTQARCTPSCTPSTTRCRERRPLF